MKRGLKTCTTLRAAIIACVICAALLALTSANILFPGLSLAVFVLSSMPVLLMMIGLIAGLIPMFLCLLMALAALLRVGGAMLLGFGALYLLPMTAVYVYCLLRKQPFWHSCAALALALTNQVLSAVGKPMLPIESATVEQLVTTGLTVAAALAGWWKNNSFTPEAIEADGYLEKLRKEK